MDNRKLSVSPIFFQNIIRRELDNGQQKNNY